jgi:hypothetical protein
MMIPRGWAPPAEPYGGVVEISLGGDGESGDPVARITRIFQDLSTRYFMAMYK